MIPADDSRMIDERRYTRSILRYPMIYLKSALVGLATVLLGCMATPIAMLIWASWTTETRKAQSDGITIGFSPMQSVHSAGFWAFIIGLFAAGFFPSIVFLRRRMCRS